MLAYVLRSFTRAFWVFPVRNSGLICGLHPSPVLPTNSKRPTMLTNLLIAVGVVVVVAFIFSPAR